MVCWLLSYIQYVGEGEGNMNLLKMIVFELIECMIGHNNIMVCLKHVCIRNAISGFLGAV